MIVPNNKTFPHVPMDIVLPGGIGLKFPIRILEPDIFLTVIHECAPKLVSPPEPELRLLVGSAKILTAATGTAATIAVSPFFGVGALSMIFPTFTAESAEMGAWVPLLGMASDAGSTVAGATGFAANAPNGDANNRAVTKTAKEPNTDACLCMVYIAYG